MIVIYVPLAHWGASLFAVKGVFIAAMIALISGGLLTSQVMKHQLVKVINDHES
jgi:hypothetical protein